MSFEQHSNNGKCDVCGNIGKVVVCSSSMGAISYAYCEDCYNESLEPYEHMVAYISCAGHFPKDINKTYQDLCRHILNKLNISEEQFIKDVEESIKDMDDYFNNYHYENEQHDCIKLGDLKSIEIDMSEL